MEIKYSVTLKHASRPNMPVLVIRGAVLKNKIRLSEGNKVSGLHCIDTVFIKVKQVEDAVFVKRHEIPTHFSVRHSRILFFRRIKNVIISFHYSAPRSANVVLYQSFTSVVI